MAEQYFTENPTTAHAEQQVNYHLQGISLNLTTDAGVFSKNRVDYGSGVLIEQMLGQEPAAGKILDLGCGYGPIGLFAAKKWPDRQVDMVDVNERALALAKRNAAANGVKNVQIFASDRYEQVAASDYAMIVTNPPIRAGKSIWSAMIEQAPQHLTAGGLLLVVIQKKQGEPSARKLMKAKFGNCEILTRDKGYYILKSVKN